MTTYTVGQSVRLDFIFSGKPTGRVTAVLKPGSGNAINRRTGKPPQLCRGARDLQLKIFCALGMIAAWEEKCKEMKL